MKRLLHLSFVAPAPRYIIGQGIDRQIRYKKETTNGVIVSGATGGQVIRRVTFGLKVTKDTYASNEKLPHMQDQSFRHGFRRSAGPINGELSPGTYCDWHDSILRQARVAIAAITGLTITIAISANEYTLTATGGPSFLASGIKKGMVVRLTAGAFNVANTQKNIVVRLVTATVITGKPLNGSALIAEGPIATATMTIPGKYSFVPTTGHTDEAYTIEDWNPLLAVPKSEQHIGCKMNTMKVTLPASGNGTIDFDILGQDFARTDAVYFVAPNGVTSTDVVASSTAVYMVNDNYFTDITNLDFTVNGTATSSAVGGSNKAPQVFRDKVMATGQFSAYFEDGSLRDDFVDETETGIVVIVANSGLANADFVSYMMPRVKINDAGRDDPNTGISQSVPFKALRNFAGGAGIATEQTTIAYQDSAAT